MIDWRQYSRQLSRFAIVGLAATFVHVGIFNALIRLWDVQPLLANILGFSAAFCLSFSAHSRWTFSAPAASGTPAGPSTSRRGAELSKFLLTALSGLVVNSVIVYVTMTLMRLPSLYATFFMVTLTPVFLYAMNRFWVFSGRFRDEGAGGPVEAERRRRARRTLMACALLGVLCAGAMLPALWPGEFSKGGDARFHLVWQNALGRALGLAELYPRWLPDIGDGFGSPVFFIYPPVAHLAAAALHVFPFLADQAEMRLVLVTFAGLLIGALGMFAWMRERGLEKGAVLAAAFYTLAPYHLFVDVYYRGAFAETLALAWAPWIFLAVGRLREKPASSSALLAVAVGLLLATHLPSSLVLLPASALYAAMVHSGTDRLRCLALYLFAGICGVLLAGGYLGTALTHTAFINTDALFGGRSESWRWLIGPGIWPDTATQKTILIVCVLQLLVLAGALWPAFARGGPQWRALALFCAICGAAAFLMMTSLSAPIWRLETPLNKIQFPWRLLVLQTLATSLAVALAAERVARSRLIFTGVIAAVGASNFVLLAYRDLVVRPQVLPQAAWATYDAPEYRLGDIEALDALFPAGSQAVFATGSGTASIETWQPRDIRIRLKVDEPGTVAVRQFNYTGWRAVLDGREAEGVSGLGTTKGDVVRFEAPERGEHVVELTMESRMAERAGWWCSAAGLLLLALSQVWLRRRRSGSQARPDVKFA